MSYTPDWPKNKKLEEKIKSNTEVIRRAEKVNVSGVEFPIIRDKDKSNSVKIFMYNCHEDCDVGYCSTTFYNGKIIRLIDFTSSTDGVIHVAGYLKGYKNIDDRDYSMTQDRWETIQLISEEERQGLEELLKKKYATVKFFE